MSATTTLSTSTLGTTASTSVVGVGAGAGSGLCLSTPTGTYSTLALSSGIKTATFAAGTFLFASAAFVGIALLSYAITKAAMES